MKIALLSILIKLGLFLFVNLSFGQDYYPFLKQGKKWRIFDTSDIDCPCNGCDPNVSGRLYSVSNDTLINGTSFSKIFKYDVKIIKQCPAGDEFDYINPRIFGYYREDSVARKVYSMNKINSQWLEKLEFDFDLKKGDSIPYNTLNGLAACTELYPNKKGDTAGYYKVEYVSTTTGGYYSNYLVINDFYLIESKNKQINNIAYLTEAVGGVAIFKEALANYFESKTYCDCVTESNTVLWSHSNQDCTKLFNVVLEVARPEPVPEFFPPVNFTQIIVSDLVGRKLAVLQNQEDYALFCNLNKGQPLIFQAYTYTGVISRKLLFDD